VYFARRLLEGKCSGGDCGGYVLAVTLVDGIVALIVNLPHGKRLLASASYRRFWIRAKTCNAPLAR
jgi:hypothetical protein